MTLPSGVYGYGTINFGRFFMRETYHVEETNERELVVGGQSSIADHTPSQLDRRASDLLGLQGRLVPILFSDKTSYNAYYIVQSVSVKYDSFAGRARTPDGNKVVILNWSIVAKRMGVQNTVDLESRLLGVQTRANDFATSTGEVVHAPPIGFYAYMQDSTTPSVLNRVGEDGTIAVMRGLSPNVPARWGCSLANYARGRVRFIDNNSEERTGTALDLSGTGWTLSNGLVRVRPLTSGGVLAFDVYSGGAWRTKSWDVKFGGTSIGTIDSVDILNNQFDTVAIRLLRTRSPGRYTIDLTLRRGHRFVEVYYQSNTAGTLEVRSQLATAGAQTLGYITATANDADGNRYVVGSSKAFSADSVNGGLSKNASVALQAFIGSVVGGGSAVAGDTAADIYKQYLGVPVETVRAIRR